MMAMVRIETFLGMPEARLILQGARVYLCCLIGAAGLKTLDLLDRAFDTRLRASESRRFSALIETRLSSHRALD